MDFDKKEDLLENEEVEDEIFAGETIPEEENTNNEEINENEPVEEPASSDSGIFDSPIESAKAQMKKTAFQAIIKSPVFWIAIGFLLLIILAVFVFHSDYDMFGIGGPKPKYYQTPACGKVYLTWEKDSYKKEHEKEEDYEPITDPTLVDINDDERFEYEEYEYDDYITGIIWTDNHNALDVDNEIMYQAMAIAARSRLISELPDNCVVLRDYNEQAKSFTKLDGTEEKYNEIVAGVQMSKGIIIGRNGTIINALYDAFSYTKKRLEEDESAIKKYFYHLMNENEERQQVVPADWVDEIASTRGSLFRSSVMKHVNEVKNLESMSLYGAKYLLEKIDSQYELYRILETYYGRDIEYYTIDYAWSDEAPIGSGIDGCSEISMTGTTLSREEFIKLAVAYGNSHGGGAKTLGDNAGIIYDMSVANNINPELVIIRADVEGYSPGASKNNYWGLGCTNTGGYNACLSYGSLSEGIAGFLKFISKFSSLTDLMSKYAYLGDYWYNPGSWSTGGCVYASAIYGSNIPERVKNACAAGKTCTTAGGGDCVPTTDEDKEAYLRYQSRSMLSARKKIFGLDADVCTQPTYPGGGTQSGSCIIYKQGDSRWGNYKLGTSNTTMSRSGCAVTSVAIAIACSGTPITNASSFNPGALVQRMNATGGFDGARIRWDNKAISYFAPSFKFSARGDATGSDENKVNTIKSVMGNNKSVILHFKNEQHLAGHYVVLKSISGTHFSVYDPGNGTVNTYSARDLDGYVVYQY